MRGKIILVILISVMVFVMVGGVKSSYTTPSSNRSPHNPIASKIYTSHPPIRINSDADFNNQFPGRVISGFEINGTGKGYCLYVGNCSIPFTIMDCYLHHGYGNNGLYFWDSAISLAWCSNGTVMNNVCAQGGEGITLWKSTAIVVKENTCFSGMMDGIYLDHSSTNMVIDNHCYLNHFDGLCVWDTCNGNTLVNNNFSDNTRNGILVYTSISNQVSGNDCSKNNYAGITLEYSSDSVIGMNNCTDNTAGGISLWSSNKNVITYNNCSQNADYGLFMDQLSKYNRIHHNKIEYNHGASSVFNAAHVQATDGTGQNFWNTSTEGNYWSDWTNPDNDSNGLVDSPYPIDGGKGAKDYRPLTTKITIPEIPFILLVVGTVIFGWIFFIIRSKMIYI